MTTEFKFAVFLFLLIFLLFLQTINLPLWGDNGGIEAGFFPAAVSLILLILIAIYLVNLLIKKKKEKREEKIPKDILKKQIYLILSLSASVFLVRYSGLLIVIGLFLLFSFMVIEKLSFLKSILISIATIICVYLIFDYWLGLSLPTGIFG